MKLSQIKALLPTLDAVNFQLSNGQSVPQHFHVTEVGTTEKKFIDCGGTIRHEKKVSFQLWTAQDVDHRLSPSKLLQIISLAETQLGIEDQSVEIEYQSDTIGTYDLSFNGQAFVLENKKTACLAEDKCGIRPEHLEAVALPTNQNACCTPNGGCC
jgi:hypothetical protein